MLLSQIKLLFSNKEFVEAFKTQIENEVLEYKKQLSKKGSSAPIYLTEDVSYSLTEKDIETFRDIVWSGKLDEYEASYIADALLLSEKVQPITDDLLDYLENYSIDKIK